MITEERLKELIEQGATIYVADTFGVNTITLKQCDYVEENGVLHTQVVVGGYKYFYDEYLFETKAEAEWQAEFGCIEKTITLELPTWEKIENIINKMKKFGLNHNDRVLARIITNDSIWYFKLCKNLDLFIFEFKQSYIGDDLCEQIRDKFPIILGEATKENYTKACRKAKELFLGAEQ